METEYNFNFIVELDSNNPWILERIKQEDCETYELMLKAKKNIFILNFIGLLQLAEKLTKKYKDVLISAYPYYLSKFNRGN